MAEQKAAQEDDPPSLTSDNSADGIKILHLAHELEREDDLVADGDAAANEASIAALRDDGQPPLRAVTQDAGDLLGRARAEGETRIAVVLPEPVRVVLREVVGVRDHARAGVLAEDLAKGSDVVLCQRCVVPLFLGRRGGRERCRGGAALERRASPPRLGCDPAR